LLEHLDASDLRAMQPALRELADRSPAPSVQYAARQALAKIR
jgi:hypothetical protein